MATSSRVSCLLSPEPFSRAPAPWAIRLLPGLRLQQVRLARLPKRIRGIPGEVFACHFFEPYRPWLRIVAKAGSNSCLIFKLFVHEGFFSFDRAVYVDGRWTFVCCFRRGSSDR